MRKFAISDIHGCAKSFRELLQKIQFSKEDELYLLGDYIDRGPDSKGVIDYIWELQKTGYFIKCLRGNHEQMLLDERTKPSSWAYPGERNTLYSFGVKHNSEIPQKYIDWIDDLPYFFEVDEYILVHAGLDFSNEDPISDTTQMIWIRYWYETIKRDWLGNRIIVHGHTPTKLPIIRKSLLELDETPVLNIDCGCCFQGFGLGYLCALDLTNRTFTFQARIDNWEDEPEATNIDIWIPSQNEKELIRVLYFDFENALINIDESIKNAFQNGKFEQAIKNANFEYLACVSSWTDMVANPLFRFDSLEERKEAIYKKVANLFPDKDWFLEKLILIYDTENRAKHLDLKSDWYYLDGFADYFFVEEHGVELYEKEFGNRIFKSDLDSDGTEVLEWLEKIS